MEKCMTEEHAVEPVRQGGIQVIARAAEIMRTLGRNPQGLSLAAIAQEVKLPRSTVQRITNALAEEMLVEHVGAAGGVRLGPALGQLINQSQTDIISLTRPYLKALSDQVQESVSLCSLSGDRVYVIDRIVAERELRVVFPIGVYAPLHATAPGKVLLSQMTEEDVRHVLPESLPALAANTLNLSQLLKQLQQVRDTRVAWDCNEFLEGLGSCATALDTYLGLFVLCIVAPDSRIATRRERMQEALLSCREDIEHAIGKC